MGSDLPISNHVGVGRAPGQGSELHDRDKTAEVMDLSLLVFIMHHAREVEELSSLRWDGGRSVWGGA